MVLTGYSDVEAIIQAINKGRVYRYITKPWNKEDLKITIEQALETFQLKRQNRKLVDDLQKANQNLEKKVKERTREITDSIEYASRIQNALLPPGEELDKLLPSYFILNKPRNIVSGDYYWVATKDKKVAVAVADCTGHGVPGAFMSILGIASLNEILNKIEAVRAGEILDQLRNQVIKSLRQTGRAKEAKDGMEIALCVVDFEKNILEYSGAFRPLYLFRDNEFFELKGDSMPIGYYQDEDHIFRNQELNFMENDMIYMFSDGYVDQLGGPDRKTYKSKQFKELLKKIHRKPLPEQKTILASEYEAWKSNMDQIDDILIMGIRFTS
jgi:serine phosphatase RsbU (regulator of sigma subunit)